MPRGKSDKNIKPKLIGESSPNLAKRKSDSKKRSNEGRSRVVKGDSVADEQLLEATNHSPQTKKSKSGKVNIKSAKRNLANEFKGEGIKNSRKKQSKADSNNNAMVNVDCQAGTSNISDNRIVVKQTHPDSEIEFNFLDDGIQVTVGDDEMDFASEPEDDESDEDGLVDPHQIYPAESTEREQNMEGGKDQPVINVKVPLNKPKELLKIPGLESMMKELVKRQLDEHLSVSGENLEWSNKIRPVKGNSEELKDMNETAYERLIRKVHENRKEAGKDDNLINVQSDQLESNQKLMPKLNTIKSPSDTTIYAPAMKLADRQNCKIIDKISNFVESVRFEQTNRDNETRVPGRESREVTLGQPQLAAKAQEELNQAPVDLVQPEVVPGFEVASARADRNLLEAEHFKAAVTALQGKQLVQFNNAVLPIQSQPMFLNGNAPLQNPMLNNCGISNDEFFHLTCHIDKSMCEKIEKGEYVDLEKLLPKERGGIPNPGSLDGASRLEWVHKDRQTFLAPVNDKLNKITSFRRWEQAFHMYATIYCGANPTRAREIWQYISVINTAATSYVWDNVYNYDVIFRHLMAFNPQRSWAITYNQMWNLSMREPLQQRGTHGGNNRPLNSHSTNHNNKCRSGKRSDYCWNFNKGVKCKFGANCPFIEKCSFCNSPSHGLHNCLKTAAKDKQKETATGPLGTNSS